MLNHHHPWDPVEPKLGIVLVQGGLPTEWGRGDSSREKPHWPTQLIQTPFPGRDWIPLSHPAVARVFAVKKHLEELQGCGTRVVPESEGFIGVLPVFFLCFITGRYDEDTGAQGTQGSLESPAKAQNTNTYTGYRPVTLYVSVYVCTRVSQHMCRGQTPNCESWFSPSTL